MKKISCGGILFGKYTKLFKMVCIDIDLHYKASPEFHVLNSLNADNTSWSRHGLVERVFNVFALLRHFLESVVYLEKL